MVRMKMTALSLGYCAYSEADTAFSIVLTPAASPARVNLLVSIALIAASFVRNTNYDATHFARLFGPLQPLSAEPLATGCCLYVAYHSTLSTAPLKPTAHRLHRENPLADWHESSQRLLRWPRGATASSPLPPCSPRLELHNLLLQA